MREITDEIKEELKTLVYEYFAEECEVEVEELTSDVHVIKTLGGDSLMYIELLELIKKKYNLNVQLQAIGKYLIKNRPETIQKVIDLSYLLYQHENDIVNLA